jgi:hypothetical protein
MWQQLTVATRPATSRAAFLYGELGDGAAFTSECRSIAVQRRNPADKQSATINPAEKMLGLRPLAAGMSSLNPIGTREEEIARLSESVSALASIRLHLKEIVDGTAFKGSHRCAQFLCYVVEKAIAGDFESLKERIIGVELFGRSSSYYTGDDAIVRVTASDVRKRLLQHYGTYGTPSGIRISLPLGSYIPEIRYDHLPEEAAGNGTPAASVHALETGPTLQGPVAPAPELAKLSAVIVATEEPPSVARGSVRIWQLIASLLLIGNLAFAVAYFTRSTSGAVEPPNIFPWKALFTPTRATHVITSDPDIVNVQEITGGELSVSDYANHRYIPEPNKLTPEELRFCNMLLGGDTSSAAAVDTPITADVVEMGRSNVRNIDVHAARNIRLEDLKTDDNFVFLGSPRSDPWVSLFNDQLDFVFAFDENSKQEFIRNVHPKPNELAAYYPTAQGWATGQSFGIVAFVRNPDENGQVLLLAGASGEGTEAAGKLATDPSRLSPLLRACGVSPTGPLQHFELLLRFSAMAGSPNDISVIACHILPSQAVQRP